MIIKNNNKKEKIIDEKAPRSEWFLSYSFGRTLKFIRLASVKLIQSKNKTKPIKITKASKIKIR